MARALVWLLAAVLLAGCGSPAGSPSAAGTDPSPDASPSAHAELPSPATATAAPSATRHVELPNLGVALDLPTGWRIRTSTTNEIESTEDHRSVDPSLRLVRTGALTLDTSSIGPVGLLAYRDEPPALIAVDAYASDRNRPALSPEHRVDTSAGPARGGPAANQRPRAIRAFAYVDVPAGDWDLEVEANVEGASREDPWTLVSGVLASLVLVGPPATTGADLQAPDTTHFTPDPVLDGWLPATLAGDWLDGRTWTARSSWMLPTAGTNGSIYTLCARLATNPDEVGMVAASTKPQGGRGILVIGCRAAYATTADWQALITAPPLPGYDRPVYPAGRDGAARLVIAGQVGLVLSNADGARIDAAVADIPPDLAPSE